MPTVAREGEFEFRVYTHEAAYEPPHVHVVFGGEQVRINLDNGQFMEKPPPGKERAIRDAFTRRRSAVSGMKSMELGETGGILV